MVLKFNRLTEIEEKDSMGYEIWGLSNTSSNHPFIGCYFTPIGVSGKVYYDALKSAEKKLIDLGLTEIEAKAVIGRQLF
jgi:hypothetical protein